MCVTLRDVAVVREPIDSLVARHAHSAKEVTIVSPWISEAAIEGLRPVLDKKKLQIIMLPSQFQRNNDVGAVKRLKNVDLFAGLVHAKLYMFKNDDGTTTALFGSGNLTRSPMEELMLRSTEPWLNGQLEESLRNFRSHCTKWM